MKSFSVQSFGCRVNQAEAFLWTDEFQQYGLHYEKDSSKSDLILVNTCTVTSRADRDARNFIRRIHRKNPEAKMVVTGCFAERSPQELAQMPGVWMILANPDKQGLPERILSDMARAADNKLVPFRSRAIVKIQDGCDFSCSFCVVPSVRGNSSSRDPHEILEQIREYINRGFKEIVITGINLGLYGKDQTSPTSFLSLLELICQEEASFRIRLSSLDPRFLDSALLAFLTNNEKICPHFHLSLQHGADRIIAQMGRNIKVSAYKRTLNYLQRNSPEAALGTDIIAGFPGETEADFSAMYGFLEESPLTYFHVFSFSPRPGTQAATWKEMHPELKKERAKKLHRLGNQKNLIFRQQFVGKERQAVVIDSSPDGAKVLTDNYMEVQVPVCSVPVKEQVKVKITAVQKQKTKGEIKSQS